MDYFCVICLFLEVWIWGEMLVGRLVIVVLWF